MELAQRNAELVLSQDKERIKREEGRTIGAVKEIALKLGLPGMERIGSLRYIKYQWVSVCWIH